MSRRHGDIGAMINSRMLRHLGLLFLLLVVLAGCVPGTVNSPQAATNVQPTEGPEELAPPPPTATQTPVPSAATAVAPTETPASQPLALTLLYSSDTWGYVSPCG